MINLIFNYPIMVFKKKDKNLYAGNERLDIFSKGGGKFYKGDILVIDSQGKKFQLVKSSIKGRASFWESLKHIQPMYEMNLYFKQLPDNISLNDLKVKAMQQVALKPKFWSALDTFEGIQLLVDQAQTYRELILIFR